MRILLGLVAIGLAVPSAAQLVIAPPVPPPLPLDDDSILAFGEAETRMTVPVRIGDRGPWDFIVDTGSERTVVSRQLAGVLGLPAGADVRVTAMTGTSTVSTVIVPKLSVSTISQATIQAPALETRHMGAVGMLGIDALQGHSVAIDFDAKQMKLRPSRRRTARARATADEIVIVARSLFGQLIVTDAHWRNVRIAVVIDTGSPVSIGNRPLLAAIAKRPKRLGPLSMTSATGQVLVTDAFIVDRLDIGGVGFSNVRVAFSDAPPFRRFGLEKRPALLLGMDVLRLFRTVNIDFANREIRFRFPRGMVNANRMIDGA
ncbi:MAG TPA: aspartyl protease family protein [Sphingomonas sp.]|nr:aspartyl protease family protein [Sphingomonas sp.]